MAGLSDSNPRSDTVKLDFLKKGRWRMRLWRDAADSDVHAEHLENEERVVTPGDLLNVNLAPAGGFVAWLTRQ
jgi:hypothetical protein